MIKLYQEELMDHFKNPRNHGKLENANCFAEDHNPSCGDKVSIELSIEDRVIKEVGFTGIGCVLSQASTSMLIEECLHKNIDEVSGMSREDVLGLVKLQLGPVRVKCAMLPLVVLKRALKNFIDEDKS